MTAEIIKPNQPALVTAVAVQHAEGVEVQPYAVPFTPPYPLLAGPGIGGSSNGGSTGTGIDVSTGKSEQNPAPYDLEWTAGDTADFGFFFDNVCWMPIEPSPAPSIPWEKHSWASQVRFGFPSYYGYWWPPIRPYGSLLFSFDVLTTWYEDFSESGPGTLVTLRGCTGWPGEFVWDLQTTAYPDPDDDTVFFVRTWMKGKAKINPQVTVLGTHYYGDWGYWAPSRGLVL